LLAKELGIFGFIPDLPLSRAATTKHVVQYADITKEQFYPECPALLVWTVCLTPEPKSRELTTATTSSSLVRASAIRTSAMRRFSLLSYARPLFEKSVP
jgi:hypothetical protein